MEHAWEGTKPSGVNPSSPRIHHYLIATHAAVVTDFKLVADAQMQQCRCLLSRKLSQASTWYKCKDEPLRPWQNPIAPEGTTS